MCREFSKILATLASLCSLAYCLNGDHGNLTDTEGYQHEDEMLLGRMLWYISRKGSVVSSTKLVVAKLVNMLE